MLVDPSERFWAKVDVGLCWTWTAGTAGKGYGQFWDGRKIYAHRWAWEFLVGSVPEGLELDHLCRNRRCVNPDHLEPVTRKENLRRSWAVNFENTRRQLSKAHCPQRHEYTRENTFVQKSGGRRCRTCDRDRSREYQRARRLRSK